MTTIGLDAVFDIEHWEQLNLIPVISMYSMAVGRCQKSKNASYTKLEVFIIAMKLEIFNMDHHICRLHLNNQRQHQNLSKIEKP